jgi:hypothetical protein
MHLKSIRLNQPLFFSYTSCSGDACVTGPMKFYWSYSSSQKLSLQLYHLQAINKNMNVNNGSQCILMGATNNWKDLTCSISNKMVCEFDDQGLSPTGNFKLLITIVWHEYL